MMTALSCVIIGAPTVAQDVSIVKGGAEIQAEANTHAPLRLTPDKSELIRLPRGATSVIVGNPAHITVLAESDETLVVVPRKPGASHFTALDEKGDIIIQRHVIVASPQRNYLRVRRTCKNGDESCQDTSVYYCPGMCHEIAMGQPENPSSNTGEASDAEAKQASASDIPPVPGADSP